MKCAYRSQVTKTISNTTSNTSFAVASGFFNGLGEQLCGWEQLCGPGEALYRIEEQLCGPGKQLCGLGGPRFLALSVASVFSYYQEAVVRAGSSCVALGSSCTVLGAVVWSWGAVA